MWVCAAVAVVGAALVVAFLPARRIVAEPAVALPFAGADVD